MNRLIPLKFANLWLTCLMLALTILILPVKSNATIFHVSKTGNDLGAGTSSSPFQTITKGVSLLSAGDTLFVHSGTYAESILSWKTKIPNGKSWDQPIIVAAYPGDTVTINPKSKQAFFWIQDGEAKYLIIEGFVIDGLQQAQHGLKFSNHSTHIRVKNCEIKNTFDNGILVSICSGCTDPANYPHDTYHEFLNLDVHDNGAPPSTFNAHGFYIETSHNLVEHGKFHHNAGNGGKFFHGNLRGVANHNIARHNEFYHNSQKGKWTCGLILSSGDGNVAYNNIAYGNFAGLCILHRVTNARLFNNIAYENTHYGIYVGFSTTNNSYVENNTVYNNSEYGIFIGDDTTNTNVINNIAYLNKVENISLQKQTGTTLSHNLITDPKFKNSQTKDFRLMAESPAIDKGYSLDFFSDDFEGQTRPQGTAYDIGAFERILEVDQIPPNIPKGLHVAN